MRAIIEIFLAILFTVISGTTALKLSSRIVKREAIIKVSKGLSPLENFTKQLTKK